MHWTVKESETCMVFQKAVIREKRRANINVVIANELKKTQNGINCTKKDSACITKDTMKN